jgi:hypothetical protein
MNEENVKVTQNKKSVANNMSRVDTIIDNLNNMKISHNILESQYVPPTKIEEPTVGDDTEMPDMSAEPEMPDMGTDTEEIATSSLYTLPSEL